MATSARPTRGANGKFTRRNNGTQENQNSASSTAEIAGEPNIGGVAADITAEHGAYNSSSQGSVRDSGERTERRGRPRGSKNKPKEGNEQTVHVQETVAGGKIPPKETRGRPRNKPLHLTAEEAQATAVSILQTVEFMGTQMLGAEAKYSEFETFMLYGSLPKLLETMDINKVTAATNALYPIMGIAGLGVYIFRIYSISRDKAKEKEQQRNEFIAEQTIRDNGEINTPPNYSMNGEDTPSWNKGIKLNSDTLPI